MKTLETERLILRSWKLDDVDDFYEYASNPNVGPNAGWEPHKTRDISMNILTKFIENDDVWAIVYKENMKVIGSMGLHNEDKKRCVNARMIGYVLSEDYWGIGLMTEGVTRAIKYAFEDEKVDLVSCYHYPFNNRSKRVIEKCNFKFEGILRSASKIYDGTIYDDCCYSITKDEYEAESKCKLFRSIKGRSCKDREFDK